MGHVVELLIDAILVDSAHCVDVAEAAALLAQYVADPRWADIDFVSAAYDSARHDSPFMDYSRPLVCGGLEDAEIDETIDRLVVARLISPAAAPALKAKAKNTNKKPTNKTLTSLGAIHYWDLRNGASVSDLIHGDEITTVSDLIGGVDLVAPEGFRPTYADRMLGGRDAAFFNDAYLRSVVPLSLGAFTVACVSQVQAKGVNGVLYELSSWAESGSGMWLNGYQANAILVQNTNVRSSRSTGGPVWWDQTSPQITVQAFDGAHDTHVLHVAGIDQVLPTQVGNDPGVVPVVDYLHIGARNGGSVPVLGWVGEIAVFGHWLDALERAELSASLVPNYDVGY